VTVALDPTIRDALERGGIVDITTIGRQTGEPRRLEIVLHSHDGRFFISGKPGWPRSWIANLAADPRMTVHLKRGIHADVPAHGRVITDRAEREAVLPPIAAGWGYPVSVMVTGSPLIEVTFD
jgi:deazaflavin-dependent oxidoreductase (nitroreductase family)